MLRHMTYMDNGPKIIRLRQDEVVDTLETILDMAKEGKITSFIASGILSTGEIFTSVSKADSVQEHTLIAYLQTTATMRVVNMNADF